MEELEQGMSWSVETHEHKERSVDWYWTAALIVGVAALLSVIFGNSLLAIMLVVAGGSVAVLLIRGPREHRVAIDNRGVVVDGTLYRWQKIDSFWVEQDPHPSGDGRHPRLLLSMKGVMHSQMIIPLLSPARAAAVRQYLKRHVKEEEQGPHLGEHLAEALGL